MKIVDQSLFKAPLSNVKSVAKWNCLGSWDVANRIGRPYGTNKVKNYRIKVKTDWATNFLTYRLTTTCIISYQVKKHFLKSD